MTKNVLDDCAIIGGVEARAGLADVDPALPPNCLQPASVAVITDNKLTQPHVTLMHSAFAGGPATYRFAPWAALMLAAFLRQHSATASGDMRVAAAGIRPWEAGLVPHLRQGKLLVSTSPLWSEPMIVLGRAEVLALTPAQSNRLAALLEAATVDAVQSRPLEDDVPLTG